MTKKKDTFDLKDHGYLDDREIYGDILNTAQGLIDYLDVQQEIMTWFERMIESKKLPVYEKEVADNHESVRGYVSKPHEIDCMLREICNNHR